MTYEQSMTSNEGPDQISAGSDGLIESYGIADRNPRRGGIEFLPSVASIVLAISPPVLRGSTNFKARSNPSTLGFCFSWHLMAVGLTDLLDTLREAGLLF